MPDRLTQEQVEAEIARLRDLGPEQLRAEWRRQMRTPPPSCFKSDLLFRALACQLQVKAFGGLDRATERLLDRLAEAADPTAVLASLRKRRLKPGSEFIREWAGSIHRVVVVENGYAHAGQTYGSLSEIARLITGTNWNGPRFFGLRQRSDQSVSAGARRDRGGVALLVALAAIGRSIRPGACRDHLGQDPALPFTPANRPSMGSSRSSIRSMPSARPPRPTSSRRPMRAGAFVPRATTTAASPAAPWSALP